MMWFGIIITQHNENTNTFELITATYVQVQFSQFLVKYIHNWIWT